ncbi:TetR/AcrR family transcriptional regulator [Loktanella sp. DJP18]|uniref:TetR/AcrR family transcriptional regulator n=1 Tax=Loktanella sp. DJP18 TaxID=3409788 RepID=UPI003BB494CC
MTRKDATYHHGNLRAALIAEGIALLEEQGPEALSLRTLAARVGVSHTAPRNHFGARQGLLTAIATEGFHRHAAHMAAGLPPDGNRRDALNAAARGYVGFARAHPHLYALMFSPTLCDKSDPDLQAAGQASFAILQRISTGLHWPGADGPDRQGRTEALLWSIVHGFAELQIAGLLSPQFDVLQVMPQFRYDDEKE